MTTQIASPLIDSDCGRDSINSAENSPPHSLEAAQEDPVRLEWIDALKIFSILGVIGIHVTADSSGLPYSSAPAAERIVPNLARALGTAFNYPTFFIVSFFLLARSVCDSSQPIGYGAVIHQRIRRLAPPFLIWSVIYLAVRNAKALAFGYHDYYLAELSAPTSWLRYLLTGSAQYHLHFLPTLIGLTLFVPLYRSAYRWPVMGSLLVATLMVWPSVDHWIYTNSGLTNDLLALSLSASKLIGFAGYGFLGFALYRIHQRGLSSILTISIAVIGSIVASVAGVILFEDALATAEAGRWLDRSFVVHLAYYLMPASISVLFILLRDLRWPPVVSRLSALSFGVYLFHPIVLDSLEIAERGWNLTPAATVGFNFVAVTTLSFLFVTLASRVRILRPLFGLSKGR